MGYRRFDVLVYTSYYDEPESDILSAFRKYGAVDIKSNGSAIGVHDYEIIAPNDFVERLYKYAPQIALSTSFQFKSINQKLYKRLPEKWIIGKWGRVFIFRRIRKFVRRYFRVKRRLSRGWIVFGRIVSRAK